MIEKVKCSTSDFAEQNVEKLLKLLQTSYAGKVKMIYIDPPYNTGHDFVSYILNGKEETDYIVLDFFSGSATTADATMSKNAEDGGNRKYILVQLPENIPEGSKADKEGYKNICEIGKERIRRAGKKIVEDLSHGDTATRSGEGDITGEARPEDSLCLRDSVAPCENEYVGAPLIACLDAKAKMTTEFFIEFSKLKPGVAFFRDDAFADDSARTNLQQAFDQFSPTTSIKVI